MAESVIKNSLANEVSALHNNRLENSNVVNLVNYSSTNKYTAPSDGYAYVSVDGASGYGAIYVMGSNEQQIVTISERVGYARQSLFVKKGMKMYAEVSSVQNVTVRFIGLS